MKKYIGVKLVEAEPMDAGEAMQRGFRIDDKDRGTQGYLVIYPGGYKSWSPKDVFETAYFGLESEDDIIVTYEDVAEFLVEDRVIDSKIGEKTTVVQAGCLTGFELTETSTCVDPAKYDQGVGTDIALRKIMDEVWSHLGFVLQWAMNGLNAKK